MSVDEMRDAYRKGLDRSNAGRARDGKHRYGWKPTASQQRMTDGESAVAEFLVARAMGREWLSDGTVPDDPALGDVAGGVQVRWTQYHNGRLVVHEGEYDNQEFVLVTGHAPNQVIRGWMRGWEAKASCYWDDTMRHPAYFVPQQDLHPGVPE